MTANPAAAQPGSTKSQSVDLARCPDFELGSVRVSPASRMLSGPAGEIMLEPRVMQVLVALADASGEVVSRDTLLERCWHGQIVGDDSVHRAIGELRRGARAAGADFTVETIARVGHRLRLSELLADDPPVRNSRWSRRRVLAASAAAATVAGAVGYAWIATPGRDPRVTELIAQGRLALRPEEWDSTQQAIGYLRRAVALAPNDALAWGTLALAWRHVVEMAEADEIAAAVASCEEAIRRALALEARQAEALAAQALLPPIFGNWSTSERNLTRVLAIAPDQRDTLDGLGILLFSVGRIRDAVEPSARLVALDPLSPIYQYRHAYRVWSTGDLAAADRIIDSAMQLWPTHPAVWYARFLIFVGSGRIGVAKSLLARHTTPDPEALPASLRAWPSTLAALESNSPSTRQTAISAQLTAAGTGYAGCTNALIGLSQLGELDAAFAVAEAAFLHRGPMAAAFEMEPGVDAVNDQRWRKTMVFFTPATARLRADRRFDRLCADIGLTEYWQAAGVRPDHLTGGR